MAVQQVTIPAEKIFYNILIGGDLLSRIPERLDTDRRSAIITDSNVNELYAGNLNHMMQAAGHDSQVFDFPAGEKSKTQRMAMSLIERMSTEGFGRDSRVLALGGGVVGDLGGYVAAIFRRGIPLIQIPTTILAQADSSIGGKVGVDTDFGKNLVGAFKHPDAVYMDMVTLKTLSRNERINGLAETIKHGVILDPKFFDKLEEHMVEAVLKGDIEAFQYIAEQNSRIKGHVVMQDPNEEGLRRILNYGHTAGHAIEKLANYVLPHGECVAIGMNVAGTIAYLTDTGFTAGDLARQNDLLRTAGLPTTIPGYISNEDIINVTSHDKKAKQGRARYCLPSRLGKMAKFDGEYAIYVDNKIVEEALNRCR